MLSNHYEIEFLYSNATDCQYLQNRSHPLSCLTHKMYFIAALHLFSFEKYCPILAASYYDENKQNQL